MIKLTSLLNEIKIIAPPDAVGITIDGKTEQFYFKEHKEDGWILNVDYSNLKTLRILNKSKLERLDCTDNSLEQLDLSNCTNLKELWCHYNNLTNLNISNGRE